MKKIRKRVWMMLISAIAMLCNPAITWASDSASETVYEDAETIKMVQEKLNEKGYDCGTPDGISGQNTQSAISKFEEDNGLPIDGAITSRLIDALNNTSDSETKNESGLGVDINEFVERYNEGIDYYNAIAERDGYNKASYITKEMATGAEKFNPDGQLELCVNPNTNHKDVVGIINIYTEDSSSLDSNIATGEMLSMIYAFDTSLKDGGQALELIQELSNNGEVAKNGITYSNFSLGGLMIIKGEYDGFNIEEDSYKSNDSVSDDNESVENAESDSQQNSVVEDAYNDAISLTKDDLTRSDGRWIYKGIPLLSEDCEWIDNPINKEGTVNQGAIYRKIAKLLVGFEMNLADYQTFSGILLGFTPETRDEFAEYANNCKTFITTEAPVKPIMQAFEKLEGVTGTFDYDYNTFGSYDVIIKDLSAAAKELQISEEMLGYMIAELSEYAATIVFDGNSCQIVYSSY